MKQFSLLVAVCFLFTVQGFAQTQPKSYIRQPAIGISFLFDDYQTAQRVRSGGLSKVFRDDQWAKFNEMSPGLGVSYFKGLSEHVDFAATLAGAYVDNPIPGRSQAAASAFLLEGDASVNLKMVTDRYFFTPYLSAGLGAAKYKGYYGAFVPLGGGIKFNFFDEAALFINARYHVPVTTETTSHHFVYGLGIAGIIGRKSD